MDAREEETHYYSTTCMRVVKSWVASTSIGLLRIECQFVTIFVSNIIFTHLSSVVLEIYVPLNSSGAVLGLETKTIN